MCQNPANSYLLVLHVERMRLASISISHVHVNMYRELTLYYTRVSTVRSWYIAQCIAASWTTEETRAVGCIWGQAKVQNELDAIDRVVSSVGEVPFLSRFFWHSRG